MLWSRKMARAKKYLKLLFHITILGFFSYIVKNQKTHINVKKVQRYMPDIKHLLLWTSLPGVEKVGQKYFIDHNCHHVNCYFTSNRSHLEDLRYFDAIIFNAQDISEKGVDLPDVRSKTQKYIFASNDSADNYPVCNAIYDNFFNWTWTYRPDSSIPYKFITVYNLHDEELGNHFQWVPKMKPISNQLKSSLSSKSQAAAIFLDKCETKSKREYFLKNLKYYLAKYNLTVDVYGKCGTMRCGRRSMRPCFYRLRTTYYFYLALEDSLARDFISTSVLYGYHNNAVPVVLGGAAYDKYLPPYSYLDGTKLGEDKLAKLMYEAIKDKQKYYDFFKWTNHYMIKESTVLDACVLCSYLNNPNWISSSVSYTEFRGWWHPFFQLRCDTGYSFDV